MIGVVIKSRRRAEDEARTFIEDLRRPLNRYAQQIASTAKRNLKLNQHVATGKLMQSIAAEVAVEGDEIQVRLMMLEYGVWVEVGRRPGSPPPPTQAIVEWMNRKGVRPEGGYSGEQAKLTFAYAIQQRIAAQRGGSGPPLGAIVAWMDENGIEPKKAQVQWQWARMIAERIAQNGIEPTHFLTDAVEAHHDELMRDLQHLLAEGA